jgi:hypothetical protein
MSGLHARSSTRFAGNIPADFDLFLAAMNRVQETHTHTEGEVCPTPRAPATTTATSATSAAETEEIAEEVTEMAENFFRAIEAGVHPRPVKTGVTEPVIGLALGGIGEHRVSLRCFLKSRLGLRIIWIAIRMILHRKLAISLLDLRLSSRSIHTEDVVIIPLIAHLASLSACCGAT